MAETKKPATAKKAPAKKAPAKAAPAKEAEVKEEVAKVEEPVKEAKKEAKKAKVEAPQKPVVTSARATAYNVRVTPRKARLVIDLIRGLGVNEALGILANVNKAASPIVAKVVKSAASNAINNFGMDEERLYVAEIYANDGLRMKRYLPRAKGSASGLVKRTSHITVVVKQR